MLLFTIWTVQSAVTCESGRALSPKSVYFGTSKLILYFPYFMYHVLYFHCVLSHCNFRVLQQYLRCFREWSHSLLIKWFNFVFTKDLPLISQSNVQAVKAEKEEWYTLSNIIYIKLQNYCFFSLRSILKLLNCAQTN